jgi:protein-tyrosine-phosphatase
MSDELIPQEGTENVQEPQLTPTQEQALSSGWVPKESFKGDPDKWVDAAEFIRRGELFSKIDHQNREIKELRRTMEALAQHHQNVSEVEYQRALTTLKAQKKAALEEGDADLVIAVDEQLDAVKEMRRNAPVVEVPKAEPSPQEFVAWQAQNPWYESDEDMRDFADAIGFQLHNKGLPPNEVLAKVTEKVRKNFPAKFTNPRQARPSPVEGSSAKSSSSSSFSLTPEERKVMNTFVRQKVMTEEQYIAELKKVKGV